MRDIYNKGDNNPNEFKPFTDAIVSVTGIYAKNDNLPIQACNIIETHTYANYSIVDVDLIQDMLFEDGIVQYIQCCTKYIAFKNNIGAVSKSKPFLLSS